MKNLIKKWYFWVIVVVVVGIIGIGAGGDTSTDTPTEPNASVVETTIPVAITKPAGDSIDSLKCEIVSATLGDVDHEGNPTVVITYNFTNNSKEPASFYTSFTDTVYQNGIECEPNYGYGLNAETNEDKEIKPGATLEVTQSYVLNDTTTDVVVELTGWISLDETVITKTFKIAE